MLPHAILTVVDMSPMRSRLALAALVCLAFPAFCFGSSCLVIPLIKQAVVTAAYGGDCKDGLAHGRGRYGMQYGESGQFTMEVDGNFIESKLDGTAKITISSPSGKTTALGTFKNNQRHGLYVSLSPTGKMTQIEYVEDRPWEGILFAMNRGVPVAMRFTQGKQTLLCRGDGQSELNCSQADRDVLFGQGAAATSAQRRPRDAANPQNLPRFVPPIISERVRLPNGDWDTMPRYQYPCPSGYYCPPAEEVYPRSARPVIQPMPTTGVAGAIADVCREIDCGEALARRIISRSLRTR